jgi:glutaconyl-CoA/methylmalonyl-CoA decarboxylase subunit delta
MFLNKRTLLILVLAYPLSAELTRENAGSILKITVYGFLIVLIALTAVYLFVMAVSAILRYAHEYGKKREIRKIQEQKAKEKKDEKGQLIPDETAAAIMTAVYLYKRQTLEEEKAKLTFERWAKPYSPWSSKIYGLRQPIVLIKRAGK